MAIKNIIAKGIGFSPATVKWIVTHGFGIGADVTETPYQHRTWVADPRSTVWNADARATTWIADARPTGYESGNR
jgi:hypothetical protein